MLPRSVKGKKNYFYFLLLRIPRNYEAPYILTSSIPMKTIIHVNQHIIRSNSKNNEDNPVITCKTYKENKYAHEAIVYGQDGLEACRIIYNPNNPLSCGAKVWIETQNKVVTSNNKGI